MCANLPTNREHLVNQSCTIIYADRTYKGTHTSHGILINVCGVSIVIPCPKEKPPAAAKATKGHLAVVK
jgi:hypothetical protein